MLRPNRFLLVFLVLAAWFALGSQLFLIIQHRRAELSETVIRYFSYFTILSNLLVALCCSFNLIQPEGRVARFFAAARTQTAICVYILVVGLVYNVILRFIWSPTGLQKVTDETLHSVVPLLFLAYWALHTRKEGLDWGMIGRWLIFPAVYCVFILLRGSFSGFYPYPFIDLPALGAWQTILNCTLLLLVFTAFSAILIGTAKFIARK